MFTLLCFTVPGKVGTSCTIVRITTVVWSTVLAHTPQNLQSTRAAHSRCFDELTCDLVLSSYSFQNCDLASICSLTLTNGTDAPVLLHKQFFYPLLVFCHCGCICPCKINLYIHQACTRCGMPGTYPNMAADF